MRPSRIAADLSVTAKGYVRSAVGIFFSLVFPIILIALFGFIFSGNSTPPTLYVVNADHNSPASQALLASINQTGAVSVSLEGNLSESAFADELRTNQYPAGLYIPEGFAHAVATGRPVNVSLYVIPGDAAVAGAAEGALGFATTQIALANASGIHPVGYTTSQVGGHSYAYVDYLIPGLIGFSILTSPMFAMVEVVSTYRKEGLFRQLTLTPLTRSEWLTSKILWYSLLTFASAGILLAIGVFGFHSSVQVSWEILPFLFLGPFLFVSLGMLMGAASRTPESAAIFGNIVTFPMMFLAGTFFPVASFPPFLQVVARVLPLYYVIDGMDAVMLYGNSARALTDLAIVAVLAVIIFLAAVRIFQWREE